LVCARGLKSGYQRRKVFCHSSGKGYGKQLYRATETRIRQSLVENLVLWVFEKNTRARSFYEAVGYLLGVPAASLRKFTLAYCTQDQPLSSAFLSSNAVSQSRPAECLICVPKPLPPPTSYRPNYSLTRRLASKGGSIQSAGELETRSATDPLACSRVHTLGFFLIGETVGAVWDHVRVHERRYTSKVLIGDRVARRPQLVHNFRNPQRVPHQHRI
jgi:hypothetical protein